MRAVLKKSDFKVTVNKAFREVLTNCSVIKRKDQAGTWITSEMKEAYIKLFEKGFAKSYEVWYNNKLAGGLYGVDLNNGVFCGESMFNKQSNASKVAFITLVQEGGYKLIDCQLHTKHLESLGAKHISREAFIKYLAI
jgi:leucyl/phenylalanyl-tRNA--protein transferase